MPLSEKYWKQSGEICSKEEFFVWKLFAFKLFLKNILLLHYLTQIFNNKIFNFIEKQTPPEKLRSTRSKKKIFTLDLF